MMAAHEKNRRAAQLLTWICVPVFFVNFVVHLKLQSEFTKAPLAVNASRGQLYPWDDHGAIHFLTYNQSIWNEITWIIGAVTLIGALLGRYLAEKTKKI
jgi:hypothetical protein